MTTEIEKNIREHGFHITIVANGVEPRYAYTIGINKVLGFELLFAGGVFFMKDEVLEIINKIFNSLKHSSIQGAIEVNPYGIFRLTKAHSSWCKLMMLGYYDYFKENEVQAFQILPNSDHFTLDIPDMSVEWTDSHPIWKWLFKKWDYPVPQESTVTTNLEALQGESITEIMRWGEDEWEAFAGAGPDVKEASVRVVSLGTLVGIDKSLEPMLSLTIGKGLWRDIEELDWKEWN
jgi:hypothetical protein